MKIVTDSDSFDLPDAAHKPIVAQINPRYEKTKNPNLTRIGLPPLARTNRFLFRRVIRSAEGTAAGPPMEEELRFLPAAEYPSCACVLKI